MSRRAVVIATLMLAIASSAFAQTATPTTVVKPEKHIDSLWNGALIGLGAGAVAAWAFTRGNCGPPGYDKECTVYASLAGTAIFLPAGTIAGAIIDRLINKPLPPSAKAHASVAPMLSRRDGRVAAGAMVRLKITF